jgi:DNA-binding transcriptional ArsR family regulator
MLVALPARLREQPLLRYALTTVGMVVLFGVLFEQDWPQVAIVVTVLLAADATDVDEVFESVDARHFRALFGLMLGAVGAIAVDAGDPAVAAVGLAVGGWLVLDAFHSFRAGIEPSADPDPDDSELFLSIQVSHLLAEELESGPETVPELAARTDMTESRVRATLELMADSGIVYRESEGSDAADRWVLDESKVGPWAFVRDNGRRLVARPLRPLGLFVPR